MIAAQKSSVVNLNKLVKGMTDIAQICITDTGKTIHNGHFGSIHGEGYIGLMSVVHFVAGTNEQIFSVGCYTRRACIKGVSGICAKKTAGALGFPVFGISAYPIDFFGIVFFSVVCTGEDIIAVTSFVKSTEYRQ